MQGNQTHSSHDRETVALLFLWRFFLICSFALLVVACVVASAEFLLRRSQSAQANVAPRSNTTNLPDPWTAFRLSPNMHTSEDTWTNSHGIRSKTEINESPDPKRLRVAVMGSSVVMGSTLALSSTISQMIEHALMRQGVNAEAINFGLGGSTLQNTSALLQNYVFRYQPRYVVVVLDIAAPHISRSLSPLVPGSQQKEQVKKLGLWEGLWMKITQKSAVASRLQALRTAKAEQRALRAAAPAPADDAPESIDTLPARVSEKEYAEHTTNKISAHVAAIQAFCDEKNIKVMFVNAFGPYSAHSSLEYSNAFSWAHTEAVNLGDMMAYVRTQKALLDQELKRLKKRRGIKVLEVSQELRNSSLFESLEFTNDGIHLMPNGNRAIADVVSDAILKELKADL